MRQNTGGTNPDNENDIGSPDFDMGFVGGNYVDSRDHLGRVPGASGAASKESGLLDGRSTLKRPSLEKSPQKGRDQMKNGGDVKFSRAQKAVGDKTSSSKNKDSGQLGSKGTKQQKGKVEG